MTSPSVPIGSEPRAYCDTCGWRGREDETINPIPGLEERVDPGGPMPVGECPKCRFLAYPEKKRVVRVEGVHSDQYLVLCCQTSTYYVYQDMHWKACCWAPRKAKSYTILSVRHTDYNKQSMKGVTGYCTFLVQYYARVEDGMYPVVDKELLSVWNDGDKWRSNVCVSTDPNPGDDENPPTPSGTSSSTKSRRLKPNGGTSSK